MSPESSSSSSLRIQELLAHAAWVQRLARGLVSGDDRADDVAQETWLRALRAPPADTVHSRGWLTRVAQNVARKLVRGERRREFHEAQSPSPGPLPSPDQTIERANLQRRVVDAVMAQDEIYRAALLLRFFEGLAPADVARALDVPVETARTRIKRGLALVRERLQSDFGKQGREWIAALAPLLAPRFGGAATVASATAAGATGASVAGLVLGGALMSKFAKVATGVVIAAVAVVGSYKTWIAPHDADARAADRASASPPPLPDPASAQAPAPAPAAVATKREEIEKDSRDTKTPPTEAGVVVEGVVLDADGRPVKDATVLLGRTSSNGFSNERSFRYSLRNLLDPRGRGDTCLATSSGDGGAFRFEKIDGANAWAIGALHDPTGIGWGGVVAMNADSKLVRANVTLERGVVVHGVVRDPAGKPVPKATVILTGTKEPPPNRAYGIGSGAETENFTIASDEGTYRSLPHSWRHITIHVLASFHPELAQLDWPWEELPAGVAEVQRDLVLQPMVVLKGRILGPDGQPAHLSTTVVPKLGADANHTQTRETIAVVGVSDDPRSHPEVLSRLGTNDPGLVYLDSDHVYGQLLMVEDRYELPLRSTLLHYVAVIARNQLLGVAPIPDPPSGPDVVIDSSLIPERSLIHTLHLHLRDGRDGSPLKGVSLYAQAMIRLQDGSIGGQILNFGAPEEPPADRELELPIAPCTIGLEIKGFAGRFVQVDATRSDAPRELTVELFPTGAPVLIHVQDTDGKAIAGAEVRAYHGATHELVNVRNSQSDEHGDLKLDSLPAGKCTLVVTRDDYNHPEKSLVPAVQVVEVGAEPASVDVELETGYEVTLQATQPNGTSAPAGFYEITDENGVAIHDRMRGHNMYWTSIAGAKVRLVDGTYTLRCVVPGRFEGSTTFVAAPGATVKLALEPIGK